MGNVRSRPDTISRAVWDIYRTVHRALRHQRIGSGKYENPRDCEHLLPSLVIKPVHLRSNRPDRGWSESMMSLSDDERLDSQDPLRHLRATDDELVPEQPKSVHDELVKIDVPLGGSHGSTVQLSLAVDAGPGCGGITWPAGEVRAHIFSQPSPVMQTPSMDRPRNKITYPDIVLPSSPPRSSHAISPDEGQMPSLVRASLSSAAARVWWDCWQAR